MATVKQTLEMCKAIVDALAVNVRFSYNTASMLELSNHIALAIDEVSRSETRPVKSTPRKSKRQPIAGRKKE